MEEENGNNEKTEKKEKKVDKSTVNLTTPILIILAVAAAFLAGIFWMKLRSTEEKPQAPEVQGESQGQATQAPQQAQRPTEEPALGAEDLAKIEAGAVAVKGPENAPVTIVEFSEYECPFCKRYVDETYSQIFEEYGNQIRYIFRDYPLPFHAHAQRMAEAARCAGDQGKYWEMHDVLFENRDEWAEETEVDDLLAEYARGIGLNVGQFSNCLTSGTHNQAVKDDLELGRAVGISGTPSFFINGQKLVGAQPFENFKAIIDPLL